MKIITTQQIQELSKDHSRLMSAIEEGFKLYSEGKVTTPPVGHMHFKEPCGDLHIKYGHIPGEEYFVVKIASHFSENIRQGLASIDGVIMLFSQKTGKPVALFEDHGYLSHLRTAIAGAIVAKFFAPSKITSIGIIGSGTQSRFQLKSLENVLSCKDVMIWARNRKEVENYLKDPMLSNFRITIAHDVDELMAKCNYIVTTTNSTAPLISASQVQPGTHITAVGADSPGKQELDPHILEKADRVIGDSRSQCSAYGEIHHALSQSLIDPTKIYELGEVIADSALIRTSDNQITIADLTGLAVQDLKIAECLFSELQ